MWEAAVLFLAVAVSAAPQIAFPFNAQVPPVARVGEPFNFQFASTTFEPDSATLQYSLTGNPSWLSLDGPSRTLWGTPGANDVGSPTFTIIAAGAAGAVTNMQATLVVGEPGGPIASENVSQQLSTAGKLSGPTRLTLLPYTAFDIKFSKDAFTDYGKNLSYYATLLDHTPLPSWITFNPGSLQFSGTTPRLSAFPQSFEILLIASDVLGFAGAWISFTLVVSQHSFIFSPWKQTVDIPKGDAVSFTSLRSQLTLDGRPIEDADLQSATAELPSWLSFDPNTFAVIGTPPSGLMSQDISIEAKDNYGDVANTTIHLAFISPLFNGEVGQLNATAGQDFNYKLDRSILAQGGEVVSMDLGNARQWLHFDPTTLDVSGTIPAGTAPQDIQATLTARLVEDKSRSDSQTFNIHVTASGAENPVVVTTLTPTASAHNSKTSGVVSPTSATGADATFKLENSTSKKKIVIIGAVGASILAILIGSVLALLFCKRLRRWRKKPKSPIRPEISRPIMQTEEWEDVEQNLEHNLEKNQIEEAQERTPDHPPQLALELPLKSLKQNRNRESVASSIGDGGEKILAAFDRSSWGYKEEMGSSHNPHESMKVPTEIARLSQRISENSNSPAKRHRRTATMYHDSFRSVGLPINRRLTGLGHGRNTYSPSRNIGSLSALRHPRDCASFSSYSTQLTSMLSTTTCAFPQPPIAPHTMHYMTSAMKRRSIRVISSVCDGIPDRRTLDERRQSYVRNRVTNRSPFFGAGSSRVSSSSYKPPVLGADQGPSTSGQRSASALPTTVRLSNDIFARDEKKEFPGSLHSHSASNSVAFGSKNQEFPGSLRNRGTNMSIGTSYSASSSIEPLRVQKRWDRSGHLRRGLADRFPRPVTSRSTTRESLRGHSLKGSFGSLRGSKVFEDAEMSESIYSSESSISGMGKKDNDDPSAQFVLSPLRLSLARKSKRENKRESKATDRISELEPEHGGKENRYAGPSSSTLSTDNDKGKGKAKASTPFTSPQRQTQTHIRSPFHTRSPSRPPSRHSARTPSRAQSSAYPLFSPAPLHPYPKSCSHSHSNSYHSCTTSHATTQLHSRTPSGALPRSLSGHILDYGAHEAPRIEQLAASNVGLRAAGGRLSAQARRSGLGLAMLVEALSQDEGKGVGLGLLGTSLARSGEEEEEEEAGLGMRHPLGCVADANGSPGRVKVGEGKGIRLVSVDGGAGGEEGRGRAWGSLRAVMRGGGSEAFL